MPQSVLDAFTAEYKVKVNYLAYESPEAAVEALKAGPAYDVLIMENELIPQMRRDGLLAEINRRNVPNFKNISTNFRSLTYDPGNKYTAPYSWGTTGLLYRADRTSQPVTRWADLWDDRYAGKVAIWAMQRTLIPIVLKSLGYSANSEKPEELEAALQRMLNLKKRAILWDLDEATIVPALTEDKAVVAIGWSYDARLGLESGKPISYVLPAEGALLWGDNLIIPANTRDQYTAEVFINFLLRPDISAKIVEESYTATANQAADLLIDPKVRNDPLVYPTSQDLEHAEIIMPISPEGQKFYDAIWQRFMGAGQ
jgi:spermidine/putrescine transport system substrate-binding protein